MTKITVIFTREHYTGNTSIKYTGNFKRFYSLSNTPGRFKTTQAFLYDKNQEDGNNVVFVLSFDNLSEKIKLIERILRFKEEYKDSKWDWKSGGNIKQKLAKGVWIGNLHRTGTVR